jgi:hypothetical protein
MEILTHIGSFIFGGAVGTLITLNISTRKTKQANISVGKGDVVAGDKNS